MSDENDLTLRSFARHVYHHKEMWFPVGIAIAITLFFAYTIYNGFIQSGLI